MDDRIETWAADFADTAAFSALPDAAKEHAPAICAAFLKAACDHPGIPPDELDEHAVRHAMLDHMPELQLPDDVRRQIPEVVAVFLESLQDAGRLGGGRTLGAQTRVLAKAFAERCSPSGGRRTPPIRNAAAKISRNDPCPCGSGKKFKKCCGA